MAACAPKTYQRILRGRRTLASAARSSTLAGRRGMLEALREPNVSLVVRGALLGRRPIRVQKQRVLPQLVRQPQSLQRAERPPVGLLRGPDRPPVAFAIRTFHRRENPSTPGRLGPKRLL